MYVARLIVYRVIMLCFRCPIILLLVSCRSAIGTIVHQCRSRMVVARQCYDADEGGASLNLVSSVATISAASVLRSWNRE